FLDAKAAGVLTHMQDHVADKALILIRGLANVGIIALVDEATGFQYDRPRRDLEEYLKTFLSDSLRKWVRTFPADYFKHLCRLKNVELRPDMKLPQYFGILTNNLVYRRIAPGLLKRLKVRRVEMGRLNEKLHSGLSLDVGIPEVLVHLGTVVGLMKLHTDYDAFVKQLDQIAPIYPETPGLFDDPKDWEPR
ncbi:MAG TPA: P63C domain-containing protein, partial [Lacipirellulaceae bacterium]|nr:P63C domain-containing protein [Lacipirellulaceae bacterium]